MKKTLTPEELKEKQQEYYRENKERIQEYQRVYYLKNKERIKKDAKKWKTKNRKVWNEYQAKKANERYLNMSEEEKDVMREYGRKKYHENKDK